MENTKAKLQGSNLEIDSNSAWKINRFSEELQYIRVCNRALACWLISQLPDYFFVVPASSTGKYHPSYTVGMGGLLRHTKAAIRIALGLLRLEMFQSLIPIKDEIIIALMVHDGWKHGKPDDDGNYSKYSDQSHAKICFEWLEELANEELDYAPKLAKIAALVLTHMGQWNINEHNGEMFSPKPRNTEECFVQMCDYLASRKYLEFNFEIPVEA